MLAPRSTVGPEASGTVVTPAHSSKLLRTGVPIGLTLFAKEDGVVRRCEAPVAVYRAISGVTRTSRSTVPCCPGARVVAGARSPVLVRPSYRAFSGKSALATQTA